MPYEAEVINSNLSFPPLVDMLKKKKNNNNKKKSSTHQPHATISAPC
jgi:hypothetical protein